MNLRRLLQNTILVISSVIVGGGAAYGQYCYTEYPITGSNIRCDYFIDEECGQYGAGIVCQYANCVNTSCQWDGWKMQCMQVPYLCMNPGCLSHQCA